MATKITKKPSLAVSSLGAPVRGDGNHVMGAAWNVPSGLTNAKKNDRATGLDVTWAVATSKKTYRVKSSYGISKKASLLNLNNIQLRSTSLERSSFYPLNANRKLKSVSVTVAATNDKGVGKSVSASRKFEKPRKPKLTNFSFNTNSGVISTTIETDAGADYHERYDTKYVVTVTSPFLNGGKPKNTSDGSSTSTNFSISYDARDYMRLSYDQFIKVVASAHARGYAGDSEKVKRTEYISYPAQATIKAVDVSGEDATGKCTIRLNTNSTTEHPVDKVRLQIAADVIYDDARDIPASEWQDTEIIDNAKCTALSIATSDLLPSRGNYTFVRLVTYHLHEGVLYRYSQPWRVTELEVPTAPSASINIEILEAHTGSDGKSAVVLLGWNKDGLDDYTGTELSWSNDENTWKSTEEPNTHQFVWSDGELEYGGVHYNDSAEITIKGLSEGEKYFIKARRYLEAENEQYSRYSNTATALTSETPESIVASASRYVADGEPLSVYWTFAGNGIQTQWQIVRLTNGELDGTIIAEGEGSSGATQISAERLSEMMDDNIVSFAVRASTGSGFVQSEPHTVTLIEQPTLEINAPSTMTEQPYGFTAQSNTLCNLIVIVTSQGAVGQFPEGILMQASGDTIHSDVYSPVWEDGEAVIELPSSLNFWDGGKYTLSVVAVDRTTGLKSPEATASFGVEWTNQAVPPVQEFYEHTTDTTVNVDESYYKRSVVKNQLVNTTASTTTKQGITFTKNGDGSYTANGTATGNAFFSVESGFTQKCIVGHKYYIAGVSGGSASTYRIRFFGGYVELYDARIYTMTQAAYDDGAKGIDLRVYNGATVNNLLFNPRVVDLTTWFGSGDEPTTTTDPRMQEVYDYLATNPPYDPGEEDAEREYELVIPEGNENPAAERWYNQGETSFVTLTVIDEYDDSGDHTQAVKIELTPPAGSSESDVYDIYRMDIEKPSLIGEGFPLTHTTVDEYAPFGKDVELRYRIAIRTVDGDVAFSDIEYTAECKNIRFDWAGGSLELPYGNSIGDSFSKDSSIRQHLNGTSSGYWNKNIERKSSLNSSIIKIIQPRDVERARALARYAGAVFVRLPNGSAFEADVQVTDLSIKNEAITAVAFDATEISLTREFLLPVPFELEE